MFSSLFGAGTKSFKLSAGAMLFASALCCETASAADQVIDIPSGPISGFSTSVPIDILGFGIGMSSSDAKALMAKQYPGYVEKTRSFSASTQLRDKSFTVATKSVLSSINGTKRERSITDQVEVDFSLPSSGSGVIGVFRKIEFDNPKDQPALRDFVQALIDKYGVATFADERSNQYCWSYKDTVPFKYERCSFFSTNFDINDKDNSPMITEGISSLMSVKIHYNENDPTKVQDAYIKFVDFNVYAKDVSNLKDQFGKSISDAHENDQNKAPVAVPKL